MNDYWWRHPLAITIYCVLVFGPLRLWLGGGNYLPSAAWYALCFIIPGFVVLGMLSSAFCVPIAFDVATLIHLALTLVYIQFDLFVARFAVIGLDFGSWGLPYLCCHKLSLTPHVLDGLTPKNTPPLVRSIFEYNGSLIHEIFWNVFICQNLIDLHRSKNYEGNWGLPVPLAILAVPAVSCLVHGITSNFNTGMRCFPNFLWVALAYHASGSVLVPGLIHAMWYFTEGKLCFSLTHLKRDWDYDDRVRERSTPSPDLTCLIGLILILGFYVPLILIEDTYLPDMRSQAGLAHIGMCNIGELPTSPIEITLIVCGLIQIILGIATWGQVRAGMEILEDTGDFTKAGIKAVKDAVDEYNELSSEEGEEGDDEV